SATTRKPPTPLTFVADPSSQRSSTVGSSSSPGWCGPWNGARRASPNGGRVIPPGPVISRAWVSNPDVGDDLSAGTFPVPWSGFAMPGWLRALPLLVEQFIFDVAVLGSRDLHRSVIVIRAEPPHAAFLQYPSGGCVHRHRGGEHSAYSERPKALADHRGSALGCVTMSPVFTAQSVAEFDIVERA